MLVLTTSAVCTDTDTDTDTEERERLWLSVYPIDVFVNDVAALPTTSVRTNPREADQVMLP